MGEHLLGTEMNLPPFGAPPDPAYIRFLEGLHHATSQGSAKPFYRWLASAELWWECDSAKWGLEDIGAAETPPGDALKEHSSFPQSSWEVQDFFVPQLFERIRKDFAALAKAHPGALVWGPLTGGDWHRAIPRNLKPSTTGGGIPPAIKKRIDEIWEYAREGSITHDKAQEMIDEIVAENT